MLKLGTIVVFVSWNNVLCSSIDQLEFLAEDEMVEIVPNMSMDPLNLISVSFSSINALYSCICFW